jgi:hypothetical protein
MPGSNGGCTSWRIGNSRRCPADAFPVYERLHRRRISYLVGPLFAALISSTGWLLLDRPPTVPAWARWWPPA